MSINALQRLSIPKKENLCSRNCLVKSTSVNMSTNLQDHTRCNFGNLGNRQSINVLTSTKLPSERRFTAPMPVVSKSTTYERKFKSIYAQREAEYDKNLKSIKVNLFKNNFAQRDRENNPLTTSRPNNFKKNLAVSVSTSMNFSRRSSNLIHTGKDRERSRSVTSRNGTSTINKASIMQKSTPCDDSILSERSACSKEVSNYEERLHSVRSKSSGNKENRNNNLFEDDNNFLTNTSVEINGNEFNNYMRKEEEVQINFGELGLISEVDDTLLKSNKTNSQKINDSLDQVYKENDELILDTNNIEFELYMKDQQIFESHKQDDEIQMSNNNFLSTNYNSEINSTNLMQKNSNGLRMESIQNKNSFSKQNYESNFNPIHSLNSFHKKFEFGNISLNPHVPKNFIQENINKINLGLFTINYENLKINKDHVAKFSKEEYRKVLSTFLRFEYGKNILEDLYKEEEFNEKFLEHHQITERMRMRMIDWMIEVLSNYKCEDNTFFLAVNILDRYFKYTCDTLKPEDLHVIGICSMFLASKFYDVYPLKLKLIVEKVGHNKFSADEIKRMEEKIVKTLNYDILKPTSFDFINNYFEEIFYFIENNFSINDETLCDYFKHLFSTCGIEIKLDFFYYEKFRLTKNFTYNMLHLLKNVVLYLAKMNCHDYHLIGIKPSLLAASSMFVAMKICEQINNLSYVNDYFTNKLCEISKLKEYDILHYAQKILYNAQNFDSCFCGLENLKKIHFNYIMELKDTK
jgi:hypothetical protein